MKVSEAINKLEVCETVWVKGTVNEINYEDRYIRAENTKTSIYLDGNAEISLTEPQAEKVVVKPFVVDWYEVNKEDLEGNIFTITIDIYDKGAQTEFEKWFNANDTKAVETLIKMKLFGYTAEQPKRWVVRQGGSEVWYLQGFRNSLDGDIVKKWCSHEGCIKFTDKAKAEAVAILVEGSVEPV